MALLFALGSVCFLVGPFPGYASLVGGAADAVTFFVGSLLFTAGGALQTALAVSARHKVDAWRAAYWTAAIQSAGTIFFNLSTFHAMHTALQANGYNRLVWRPDAFGSTCFLISATIAYRASARQAWLPIAGPRGWWEPSINLLGCVFFGVAAVAGYVVPARGSILDLAAANWSTALGAACFLACAMATMRTGHTSKSPRQSAVQSLAQLAHREGEELDALLRPG